MAAGCVVFNFPHALRTLHERVAVNVTKGTPGRELIAADGLGISQEFVERARELVPPDTSYALVDPAPAAGAAPTTRAALGPYLRFVLFPRKEVEPADARWLLCYLCDLATVDVRATPVWRDGSGLVIAQVTP